MRRALPFLALACALAGCSADPATPSAAEVKAARGTLLARMTKDNPNAPDMAELVAIGRRVNAEQAAKDKRNAY